MRLTRDGRFERTDVWREGKWLDLWSVVHFLSGISLGFGISFFHFGMIAAIIIVFLLLVAYEMWEAMVQIHETPQNRVMDVVVGMASFLPTFLFFNDRHTESSFILAFGIVLTLNIVLSALGWYESQKAAVLEQKLREELVEQKRKFKERRARAKELRRLRKLQRKG
ncbi:hypothetical protein HZC00_03920 [Candidatus Kaiserbacteria bacterium]|nr:hypothetical protein [Candidatus Kaiserbacteria bacterium]